MSWLVERSWLFLLVMFVGGLALVALTARVLARRLLGDAGNQPLQLLAR
jgi:hypothetical protein